MSQQPINQAKYDEMVRDMRRVQTKEQLKTFTLLYILDLSYPRADIALALHDVEIEKGWH